MKYFLDITPAIVNKTAIHNIIKDSVEGLPEIRDRLLILGKPYKYTDQFNTDLPRLMKWALKMPYLFILFRRILTPFLGYDKRSIFLFDPLYILFYRNLTQAKVMVLDLTPVTHPEWHGQNVAKLYQESFQLIKKLNLECHSISESTRNDLRKILKIGEDKNQLLYIYAHEKFKPHQEPVFSKQILFVGSFEPRKNLIGLIHAFQKSKLPSKGYTLNIAGATTAHFENVKSGFASDPSIIFHGYLSNDELHNIYNKAQIFAYPSHWEGFGVPLLEAVNMQIASFAAKSSACPEVGGPDMIYVNSQSEAEIIWALEKLSDMNPTEYANYTKKIVKYAGRFSFQNYIQNLKKVLES